jgi:hypothetical protein
MAVGHYTDMDKVYDMRLEIEHYPLILRYERENWSIFQE